MKNLFLYILLVFSLFPLSCDKNEIDPDPIVFSANITNVSSFNGSDGRIELMVAGGIPPYQYLWSNGKSTSVIDSLKAGEYIVTVSDKMLTNKSDTIFITQPAAPIEPEKPDTIIEPEPLVLVLNSKNTSLYGASDGAVYSNVTGGVKPYTYEWSNGSSSPNIEGLTVGWYSLTVSDTELATVTARIEVSQPEENEIIVNISFTHPSETGALDGSISLSISGGYPPYTLNWLDDSNEYKRTGLGAGEYTFVASDQMEQTKEQTIMLTDKVTDVDGNMYSIVKIGTQTWMQQNLRVTHSPDGNPIEAFAYYNDTNHVEQYGRIYTWNVAMNNSTLEMTQGLCPTGWHIPTDEEFKTLEIHLGMSQTDADLANTWRGNGIGTSLKAGGESGYNAQLSGRSSSPGNFSLMGSMEYVWTSTESGTNYAWRRCLDARATTVGRWNTFPKNYGFSVRCVKSTVE